MAPNKGPETYQESPVFSEIGVASFSFAFELHPDKEDRSAFRLEGVSEAIEKDERNELVEPFSSYHDEVTIGRPGIHGRPLIFLARKPDPALEVKLHRPAVWKFKRDGRNTRLTVDGDRQTYKFGIREAFCAFRSGHLFYVLSLTLPSDQSAQIDEYLVIQLQQLAIDGGDTLEPAFEVDGQRMSLVELARARLRKLSTEGDEPSGLLDILGNRKRNGHQGCGLLSPAEVKKVAAAISPRGLCIAIEDKALLVTAERALAKFGHGGEDARRNAADKLEPFKPSGTAPHNSTADPRLFAYAGLAQGVIDFPHQDQGELSDATCAVSSARGRYVLFAHPAFLLQIASDWRPLRDNRDTIGACPYLMLTWLAAIHDNVLVSAFEESIGEIIYGGGADKGAKDRSSFRTSPLANLRRAVDPATPGGADLLREHLETRLKLFSEVLIHRSTGLFRYPKEKTDLEAALEMMGTSERFARMQTLLGQIEAMVEDITNNKHIFADRRTNTMLFLITGLSLFSVSSDVHSYILRWQSEQEMPGESARLMVLDLKFFVIVLAFALLVVAAYRWGDKILRLLPGKTPKQ